MVRQLRANAGISPRCASCRIRESNKCRAICSSGPLDRNCGSSAEGSTARPMRISCALTGVAHAVASTKMPNHNSFPIIGSPRDLTDEIEVLATGRARDLVMIGQDDREMLPQRLFESGADPFLFLSIEQRTRDQFHLEVVNRPLHDLKLHDLRHFVEISHADPGIPSRT